MDSPTEWSNAENLPETNLRIKSILNMQDYSFHEMLSQCNICSTEIFLFLSASRIASRIEIATPAS